MKLSSVIVGARKGRIGILRGLWYLSSLSIQTPSDTTTCPVLEFRSGENFSNAVGSWCDLRNIQFGYQRWAYVNE